MLYFHILDLNVNELIPIKGCILGIWTDGLIGPDSNTLLGFPGWSRLVKSHCTIPREYPMKPHFKKESRHTY